jgi:hypothetical protein
MGIKRSRREPLRRTVPHDGRMYPGAPENGPVGGGPADHGCDGGG